LDHNILSGIYNKELKKASKVLNNLNTTNQVFIGFSDSTENNSDYIVLTENDSTLFVLDSISNHTSETLVNFKIEKTLIDTTRVYHKIIGNVFAASNNLEVLKTLNAKHENTKLSNSKSYELND